jgi:hypothetical protein
VLWGRRADGIGSPSAREHHHHHYLFSHRGETSSFLKVTHEGVPENRTGAPAEAGVGPGRGRRVRRGCRWSARRLGGRGKVRRYLDSLLASRIFFVVVVEDEGGGWGRLFLSAARACKTNSIGRAVTMRMGVLSERRRGGDRLRGEEGGRSAG